MFARSFLVACAVNQSTWREELLRLLASVLLGVAAFVVGVLNFLLSVGRLALSACFHHLKKDAE